MQNHLKVILIAAFSLVAFANARNAWAGRIKSGGRPGR